MHKTFNLIKAILGNDIYSILIDYVDFIDIIIRIELSDEFKQKYKDKFNWSKISMYPDLPEDFIRDNLNNINWYLLSKFQHKISKSWDIKKLTGRQIQDKKYRLETERKLEECWVTEMKMKYKERPNMDGRRSSK